MIDDWFTESFAYKPLTFYLAGQYQRISSFHFHKFQMRLSTGKNIFPCPTTSLGLAHFETHHYNLWHSHMIYVWLKCVDYRVYNLPNSLSASKFQVEHAMHRSNCINCVKIVKSRLCHLHQFEHTCKCNYFAFNKYKVISKPNKSCTDRKSVV